MRARAADADPLPRFALPHAVPLDPFSSSRCPCLLLVCNLRIQVAATGCRPSLSRRAIVEERLERFRCCAFLSLLLVLIAPAGPPTRARAGTTPQLQFQRRRIRMATRRRIKDQGSMM